VNQSLTPLWVTDPVLLSRRANEATHLQELEGHAARMALEPWSVGSSPRLVAANNPMSETATPLEKVLA
jgi:hypothetical protein